MLSDDDSDDDDDDDDEFEDCDAGVEHDDVAPSAEPGPESFALRKSRTMSHALINVDECVASRAVLDLVVVPRARMALSSSQ